MREVTRAEYIEAVLKLPAENARAMEAPGESLFMYIDPETGDVQARANYGPSIIGTDQSTITATYYLPDSESLRKKEFPQFPPLNEKVEEALKNLGFIDVSYGNDVCPSYRMDSEYHNVSLTLWTDHPDSTQREFDTSPEYCLMVGLLAEEKYLGDICLCNTEAEVIAAMRAVAKLFMVLKQEGRR